MTKNAWVMLVVGLVCGCVLGYLVGSSQMPANPVSLAPPSTGTAASTSPMPGADSVGPSIADSHITEIKGLLSQNPGNPQLLVALGNACFDSGRWEEARLAYEEALESIGHDANVETDLAIVYRNIDQPERALEILHGVIERHPEHWQAVYNLIVIYHYDLHRHAEAVEALDRLEELAVENSEIPDLTDLSSQVRS